MCSGFVHQFSCAAEHPKAMLFINGHEAEPRETRRLSSISACVPTTKLRFAGSEMRSRAAVLLRAFQAADQQVSHAR